MGDICQSVYFSTVDLANIYSGRIVPHSRHCPAMLLASRSRILASMGEHVFIACQSIVPVQSHPFTISSLPSDGKMEFLVRAEKGSTRRFFRYASKHDNVLGPGKTSPAKQECTVTRKVLEKAEWKSAVAVCGPEGLSGDVRWSLVALSDERAVHRGFIRMWNVLGGYGGLNQHYGQNSYFTSLLSIFQRTTCHLFIYTLLIT